MAVYTGSGGSVTIGATDLDALSWTLTTTMDVADITQIGEAWRVFVTGRKDWTATCECLQLTETDPTAYLGATASTKFYIDVDNYYEADGIVSGLAPHVGLDGAATITFTIEGDDTAAGIAFT